MKSKDNEFLLPTTVVKKLTDSELQALRNNDTSEVYPFVEREYRKRRLQQELRSIEEDSQNTKSAIDSACTKQEYYEYFEHRARLKKSLLQAMEEELKEELRRLESLCPQCGNVHQ